MAKSSSSSTNLARGRRLPEQPVFLVPGFHFFTESAPVSAGTAPKELAGLAALTIEAESPFPEDQLASGYFAAPQGGGLVAFAAMRRKFLADQDQWAKAGFVVPDFATWLSRGEASPGVVVLETREAVTALDYANGSMLPRRMVSRPVAIGAGVEEGIAVAREQVLNGIDPGGRRVRRYRLHEIPCTVKGGRYHFHWEAQEFVPTKSIEAGALSAAQLWALDLRAPDFLRTKRRDFQWNRYAWGTLVGVGLAAVFLIGAELALLGLKFANVRREAHIAAQAPAARESEANSDIVNRLGGYIDRKPQPLELLGYVNDLRPRAVYFTKVSVDGGLQMVIEGATSALADVNEYAESLKRAPAMASVELKDVRAREGGGIFKLVLAFRPGASLTPAQTPNPQPANGSTMVPGEPMPSPPGSTSGPPSTEPRPPRRGPPPDRPQPTEARNP